MRYFLLIAASMVLSSCSPVEYKKATPGTYAGQQGYLDKQLSDGVYLIEAAQIGGYQFILDQQVATANLVSHWHRRALELCPDGYNGEPEIINPNDAKLEGLRFSGRDGWMYPMASGTAQCKGSSDKRVTGK